MTRILRIVMATATGVAVVGGPRATAQGAPLPKACVVMSLASKREPPRCMPADTVIALQEASPAARRILEEVRIPWHGLMYLSDGPAMSGNLWRLSASGNADALALRGIPRGAIASAVMVPVACVYEDANFRSRERCHAPGDIVGDLSVLDRMISSLRVPPGLVVRAYAGKHGTGRMMSFTANANWSALNRHALNDAIRSLQVARARLCEGRCVIPASDAYDLRAMFGADWKRDAHRLPQLALPLDTGRDAHAMLRYGGRLTISHSSGASWVHVKGRDRASLVLPGNPRVHRATVAMSFRVGDSIDVQLVRSDADGRFVDAMPVTTLPWPEEADDVISIVNASQRGAIVLDRPRKAIGSWADALVDPPRGFGEQALLGNALTGLKPDASAEARAGDLRPPRGAAILTQYFADDRDPLAMGAAARVCRISVDRVFAMAHRTFARTRGKRRIGKRGIGNWEACASRVTAIVTLYQALFPRGWDIARYRAVIRRVLDSQPVRRDAGSADQEAEFVAAVREQTDTEDTRLADAVLGFHMANVIRAYSMAARIDLEPLAADRDALGAVACGTPAGEAGVSRAGVNTLGWYRYDLADYRYRVVLPHERRHGTPSTLVDEPFVISVSTREDTSDITALRVEMYEWQLRYMQALLPGIRIPTHGFQPELPEPADVSPTTPLSPPCRRDLPHAGRDFLAATGYSMTQGIDDALRHAYARTYADSVFVTVFFRRRPVAVLYGQIPVGGGTDAEVLMVVSAPDNVLDPERDGAVRGAGAAALNYFIQHARSQGMTAVRVQAISGPATKVTKAGFRFDDEL